MKRLLPYLLVLSLAGNLAVAGWWWTEWRGRHPVDPVAQARDEAERIVREREQTEAAVRQAVAAARAEFAVQRAADAAGVWKRVEDEDPARLVANLRAAGFPDFLNREIVKARMAERFAARRREILGTTVRSEFWKPRAAAPPEPDKLAELRLLRRDQRRWLADFFGPLGATEADWRELEWVYGPLPAAKLELVDQIESDYAEVRGWLQQATAGVVLPDDRRDFELLEQEKRRDLAAVLTPAELETYDLFRSPLAERLRSRLAYFRPTEAEFRVLYGLYRDHEARQAAAGEGRGPDLARQRAAAAELRDAIRRTLGEVRFAEFERAEDQAYRVAARIADRLQLPRDHAAAVQQYLRELPARVAAAGRDAAALTALAEETNRRMTAWLGAGGLETFKEAAGMAGSPLRALERAALTAAAPVAPPVAGAATAASPTGVEAKP